MVKDALGDRMKKYEYVSRIYLTPRTPVIIRLDGKAFHTFTRGFNKPFDMVLVKTMQETMKFLCENIQGCVLGYTQSDEITLVLVDYKKINSCAWFDYNIQKCASVAASMATMAFNKFFEKNVNDWISKNTPYFHETWHNPEDEKLYHTYLNASKKGAMFDSRCFNIPKEEVANLIYWRQLDAARNSVQMVGQANFSHSELQGKTCNMIQDMLLTQKDINWNNFPIDCKRGAACIYQNPDSITNGDIIKGWRIDREMPMIKDEYREYVEKYIYIGEGM